VVVTALALVAEPAVSAVPAVATFKFATRVVDVTVNGAVPTAILEINCVPVIVPFAPNEVRVPTLVIFGWAAVVTVPAVVAAPVNEPTNVVDVTLVRPATVVVVLPKARVVLPKITFEFANLACASVPLAILFAFIPVIDDPLPEKKPALTKLAPVICELAPDNVIFPLAANVNPVNEVLTEVMLGCAAVVNVPVSKVAVTFPALTVPVTANPTKVPTEVMFGCAFVVTVPAVVALVADVALVALPAFNA
jgi:hypothetical protein